MSNDLAQYMAGQGVSQQGVTPTIEALNRAAQGGASNYQNLLNVLATQEAAGTQGRTREVELAQTLANAGLGAEYTRQRGALTNQQLAALAQVAQTQGTQTLQAQRDAEARRQALQDAILKLQASGNTGCPEGYVKDPITSRCVPVPAE
jgi:2-hydroxychromene-2-carboxylate isomerase